VINRFIVPSLGFNVKSQIDPRWENAKQRMLIILQSVPTEDLESEVIASGPAWPNVLRYAQDHADKYGGRPSFAYAVTNFNDKRHLHLKGHSFAAAESEFKTRMLKIIQTLDPTHIFFAGDLNLLYQVDNARLKDGWVHTIENRKVTSSLDYARLIEAKGSSANLLGLFTRHLANLHLGKHPHDLSNMVVVPKLVNSIKKFDTLLERMYAANELGFDTETRSLSIHANPIYTAQFCLDTDPTVGYVLPIDHPHESNPFSQEERSIIKRGLRDFMREKDKVLLTLNGAFDLRVTRNALNLPVIYHKVWDVGAGEHALDENVNDLVSFQRSQRGLANLLASYGNDHYLTAEFKKEDRGSIGQTSLTDKNALTYMAVDVVCLLQIKAQQLLRAEKQELNGKPYRPYYERFMLNQMSDTEHVLSHLKDGGSHLDVAYLRAQLKADSTLAKTITELTAEFRDLPHVRQANALLLDDSGLKAKGLFGSKATESQWVFSLTKPAHKALLFFNVMGLKPISKTESGAPAVDKAFVAHYKDRNYLVQLFGDYQEATKLVSTYLKGWYKRLKSDPDALVDDHLRADFMYYPVATGRLASADPNFQNIPSRGKLAKIIKEMFSTVDGHLQIRYDYSAHEVRGWSIVSGDTNLANAFKEGQRLRQLWIKNPTPEIMQEMKKKGDLHIQNVYRFFQKWVEKSDPLRDAIKAIVFGLIYGKSPETLGQDTKKAQLDELKAKIGAAYKAKSPDLPALEEQFQQLLDEDRTEYAQGIIDKMFKEFPRGHAWMQKMQKLATEKLYVYSPIGRIRHLFAGMTKDKRIVRRQVRQGMNAPIQGFASEIAVKAARLVAVRFYASLVPRMKKMLGVKKTKFTMNRIVHDASYYTVPYEMVLPFIHLLQWATTYGVAREYEKVFGFKFTVEPEIEIEVGVRDTKSYKWDWSLPNLNDIIAKSVKDGIEQGLLTETYEDIMEKIYAPWKDKSVREYLNKTYPLLGVDLGEELKNACRAALSK
jgi:DNA polymerase I-like protein with 3'-5' exonuclease and polymerase domains